jgi:hypothetical protein
MKHNRQYERDEGDNDQDSTGPVIVVDSVALLTGSPAERLRELAQPRVTQFNIIGDSDPEIRTDDECES